jgi:hypothetical protein
MGKIHTFLSVFKIRKMNQKRLKMTKKGQKWYIFNLSIERFRPNS